MKRVASTVGYFFWWGLVYGMFLGTWSTTLMLPIMGTVFGLFWGIGIGGACGLVCGVLVSLIQSLTFHADVDLDGYSRWLSLGIGLLVGIMAPIMLLVSSQGFLWGEYSTTTNIYLIPSLIAVIFWGGLAAAYAAHGYPSTLAHLILDQQQRRDPEWSIVGVTWAILKNGLLQAVLLLGLVGGVGVSLVERNMGNTSVIIRALTGAAIGPLIALILVWIITMGVAAFLMFIKRLLFSSDTLITTSHTQRLILTLSGAGFIGALGGMYMIALSRVTTNAVITVAACMLLMGFYVYQAFPLYGKDKRKAAESRIEEGIA